jgi:hypothetical protein
MSTSQHATVSRTTEPDRQASSRTVARRVSSPQSGRTTRRMARSDKCGLCCSWFYELIGWPYSVIAFGFAWISLTALLWVHTLEADDTYSTNMELWLTTALALLVLIAGGFVAISSCHASALKQIHPPPEVCPQGEARICFRPQRRCWYKELLTSELVP